MNIQITNKAVLEAFHDWGDWYRQTEYYPIDFDKWLEEKWGVGLHKLYEYKKPRGFYNAYVVNKGKAALFMLKYCD
jgi:hypothetical protein